jgi:hypothetical protein
VEDGRTLVLASGDGGFLMGLSDLESLIGAASSAVVVIYNDAAYGAEIHQYGSQGLTEKPMLIPEVDFGGVARALGAESAIIRSLADLSALQEWIDAGARGTFVAVCRITSSVRAPWLSEWMKAKQVAKAKAAVAGELAEPLGWAAPSPRAAVVLPDGGRWPGDPSATPYRTGLSANKPPQGRDLGRARLEQRILAV